MEKRPVTRGTYSHKLIGVLVLQDSTSTDKDPSARSLPPTLGIYV